MTESRWDEMYLLVEDGPFAAVAASYRQRYVAAKQAQEDYARRLGCTGLYRGRLELIALDGPDDLPGWHRRRRGGQSRLEPNPKAPEAAVVAAELAALPRLPDPEELRIALGHPCEVRWQSGESSGFVAVGRPFHEVQLVWAGEQNVLLCPDPAPEIARILRRDPDARIEGAWGPPAGLRRISEAVWELIEARRRVWVENEETVTGPRPETSGRLLVSVPRSRLTVGQWQEAAPFYAEQAEAAARVWPVFLDELRVGTLTDGDSFHPRDDLGEPL